MTVPVRAPRASEIGARLAEVQAWRDALVSGSRDGRHYSVDVKPIGGRAIGRNLVPHRVRVESYEQAWSLLRTTSEVAVLDELAALVADDAEVRAWLERRPLTALRLAEEWTALQAALRWLREARGTGSALRSITAPGIDTKFVERHRGTLAEILGVSRTSAGFVHDLGLGRPPEQVRLRFHESFGGLPDVLTEGTFRVEELARLRVSVPTALVVENEATFLAMPVPADGIVLWGKGFDVDRLGALPWLRGAELTYWGDLDTHGFAILDRLRAWFPQTRSVLMDRPTLLHHRDRWVLEPSPTRARLTRLDEAEAQLYDDLVTDRLGQRVRLEQERIDWKWALRRLPETCG